MAPYSRRNVTLDHEKNIVIGLIVSDKYCRDFINLTSTNDGIMLFKSSYLRTVASWAIEYYKKYDHAPQNSITEIFRAEREKLVRDEDEKLIESTLETINEKYIEDGQRFDSELIFDQTEKYLKGRSLEDNADKIKGLVSQGKINEAESVHKEYHRIEKPSGSGLNVFKDTNAIADMFEYNESVFEVPGAFGELLQEIASDDLIMVGANSKRGKTWKAIQIALYAAKSGCKVGYFSFEMKKMLMNKRIAQCVAGGSFKEVKERKYVPEFDSKNNIIYKKRKIKTLTDKDISRAYKLIDRQCRGGEIHVFDATTSGRSIDSIKSTLLNEEEYTGRKFDFIIVDQISLVSGGRGKEKRHQLDDIAIRLKTEVCSDMGIPVMTPVQFSKQGLKSDGGEDTIAEAYSLFHHASILISLNQTKEEKERGIMRISCSGRNNDYSGEVVLLQNLSMGRFILDSRWKKDIGNYNDIICQSGFSEEDIDELEDI